MDDRIFIAEMVKQNDIYRKQGLECIEDINKKIQESDKIIQLLKNYYEILNEKEKSNE